MAQINSPRQAASPPLPDAMTVAAAGFDRVPSHGCRCAASWRSHTREGDDDDII